MEFKDKYSISNNKKQLISPEAFAVGEMIEKLTNAISKLRRQLR